MIKQKNCLHIISLASLLLFLTTQGCSNFFNNSDTSKKEECTKCALTITVPDSLAQTAQALANASKRSALPTFSSKEITYKAKLWTTDATEPDTFIENISKTSITFSFDSPL